jgi:DNA-binding GntR family transcriptional regulator
MATGRNAAPGRGRTARLGNLDARGGPPRAQTKGEFALEVLRSSIIDADFQPGQRLHIEELADQLQMSETPIREALRQLQVEGLVSFLPHRGILVAETTPDEMRVVFLMRQALETLAVRLAAPRMTGEDLRRLQQIHRKLLKAGERNDVLEFRRFNREFHVTVYRLAGSDQLYEFLRILWARLPADLLLHSENLKEVAMRDHGAVLAALGSGKVEEAARLMSEHIENALGAAISGMAAAEAESQAAETSDASPAASARTSRGKARRSTRPSSSAAAH